MLSRPLLTDSAVPASSTAASLAAAARRCEALRQARRLATWVGEGKRVTPKHVLRPIDVPAAAQVLAIPAPPRIHTAATVPALHRPWKVALAAGFLRIVDGRAVIGPALGQWPGADDDTVRELWLAGLTAAFAANFSSEDETGAAAFSRVILRALVTDPPPSLANLWERAREALMFGRWALQELNTRMPKPISADLPAEELIARIADCGGNDAWPWLADRDPLPAAREILQAAAVATPAQRVAAVELVFMLDELAQAASGRRRASRCRGHLSRGSHSAPGRTRPDALRGPSGPRPVSLPHWCRGRPGAGCSR